MGRSSGRGECLIILLQLCGPLKAVTPLRGEQPNVSFSSLSPHHPLMYREIVKADDIVEYFMYEPEGAEFGKILVYINSAIFMTCGPLAEAGAWRSEPEITDLIDGEFPNGEVSTSA